VLTTIQLLNGMEPRGERILIMGAGVIGCETALYLASQGKKVTLCARQDSAELDTDIIDIHNREMLLKMIREEKNITVLRGTIPLRLDGNGVVADQQGSEKKIPMDSLVFSGRLFPHNELSTLFVNKPNVISIGDCKAPGTIMDAVWGGFNTVREI
jgi:2-enoate reductase